MSHYIIFKNGFKCAAMSKFCLIGVYTHIIVKLRWNCMKISCDWYCFFINSIYTCIPKALYNKYEYKLYCIAAISFLLFIHLKWLSWHCVQLWLFLLQFCHLVKLRNTQTVRFQDDQLLLHSINTFVCTVQPVLPLTLMPHTTYKTSDLKH